MIFSDSGFILNLETLKTWKIGHCTKSQGKPGIVKEKSGKTNYLVHTLFSLSLWMGGRNVAVQFVVSKYEFYHFAQCYANICTGFIFLTYYYKYVNLGSGKNWVSLTIGQRKVRKLSVNFNCRIGYEPCDGARPSILVLNHS